jgi:mannosyltransferase OCH1-like enzyme
MYKKVFDLVGKKIKLFFLHTKHGLFKFFVIKTPKLLLKKSNFIKITSKQKIPKVIYQTWHSPINKLSKSVKKDLLIFKKLNPDYEYQYFLDDDIESFVHENFPGEISECFNKLNLMVGKIDLWRYLILFKNGGVYLDIDARTNSSLSKLINKKDDAVITFENYLGSNIFAQWVLIFNKNHPALKKVIEIVIENIKHNKYPNNVLEMTGPGAFSKGLKLYFREEYGIDLEEIYFHQKTNITFSKNSFQTSLIGHNFKPYMGHKPPGWESLYKKKVGWKKILKNSHFLK